MTEYLIRGDDDEPDLGLPETDERLALTLPGLDSTLSGGQGAYMLRVASVELEISDEPGFGWQVVLTAGTPDMAGPVLEVIAWQIGERVGRPVRVVPLG